MTNNQLLQKLVCIPFLFWSSFLISQATTYYKNIDLFGDGFNTGFTLQVDSMDFYVSGKTLCVST